MCVGVGWHRRTSRVSLSLPLSDIDCTTQHKIEFYIIYIYIFVYYYFLSKIIVRIVIIVAMNLTPRRE